MNQPPQRVSPIQSPDEYVLPGRAEGGAAQDTHRQTQFLLGGDLQLFAEAMGLQLRLVKDAYPSKYRTHALAAIMGLWSRTYAALGDALLLTARGSYGSTLPLVRAACELIAAQEALRGGEMDEHTKWLFQTLTPNETFKAFEFEMGRFFSGEVLASDPLLRGVYRPASDLGRPNFGATLLQVAPESNNVRLALTFADTSFHLGWAEIVAGWLLALASRQLRVIVDAEGLFPVSDEARAAYEAVQGRIAAALARDDRARIEEVDDAGTRRYLVHDFRRQSSGAPKKFLL
ncbi:MAG: hypothetical protein GEU75_00715 [Dehalococcoidia bacterium]|nr:hypothetical protein [Dehalococcoidia bacterium]